MKQTAVEWFEYNLKDNLGKIVINQNWELLEDLLKQAKEIEKEQIIDAWQNGIENCGEFNNPTIVSGKQYYNEIFKSEYNENARTNI
jgi:hypothetical protein